MRVAQLLIAAVVITRLLARPGLRSTCRGDKASVARRTVAAERDNYV
jgi:hypothetical protein